MSSQYPQVQTRPLPPRPAASAMAPAVDRRARLVLRRLVPRRRKAGARLAEVEAFYARLLALLARHLAVRPQVTQTPREFGARVRQLLQSRPNGAALADLPGQVIELFYRVRFGGQPLSPPESRSMNEALDLLARQLSVQP